MIRKYVKHKFLRGILYVLTILMITALVFGIVVGVIALGCKTISWALDLLLGILE